MRQVISAAPVFDARTLAARLSRGGAVVADPSQAMCARYGFRTIYEMPAPLQKRLRLELIRHHAATLRGHENAVFDHSVFVWLADWMRWLWPDTPVKEWDDVLGHAKGAVSLSDRIHHVIGGPGAAYDGYRWLDEGNARQIEKLCRSLYKEFGCEDRVVECSI
jgi:hypothetical protein